MAAVVYLLSRVKRSLQLHGVNAQGGFNFTCVRLRCKSAMQLSLCHMLGGKLLQRTL